MATKKKAPKAAAKKLVKKAAKKAPKAVKKAAVKKAPAKKPEAPSKAVPVPPKKKVLVIPKNTTSKQYTQSELSECVKGYCGFAKRVEAKDFYGSFAEMIRMALKSGYKVVLPGLGKIQVRRTKARKGINPATREVIQIPARKKVAFTANKALKEAVL